MPISRQILDHQRSCVTHAALHLTYTYTKTENNSHPSPSLLMVVMAPPPKLKQSSIASFLKQTEPVPESESESKPSSSDYENLRQQTIRRNQSFLQTLGIHPLPFKPEPKPKSRPKPTATPPPSAPLRRSSRHRALPPPPPKNDVIADAPVLDFADSAVFRYACDPSITLPPKPTLPPPSCPLFGFEITGMPLRDPSLAKIYTLDVSLLHKDRFLVAAGGHGGFISLFGVGEEEEGDDEMRMPLMRWKGSRSWISGVGFLEKNPMVLVSSSNDGKVVLWDIKKQPSSVAASASPAVVAEAEDLHSGGVFSMSLRGEMIATASKDSSVGVSRIGDEGEVVNERNVSGHHEGAVRGICFG